MFELILKGEKGMKSKRRLLLAALLMVVMAALLTVSASAAPKLNKKKLNLKVGQEAQLKVKGTNQKVKWSSSKPSVAHVEKAGKSVSISAVSAGKAVITANVDGKKLKCKIIVSAATPKPDSGVNITLPTVPITYVVSDKYWRITFSIDAIEYTEESDGNLNYIVLTCRKVSEEEYNPKYTRTGRKLPTKPKFSYLIYGRLYDSNNTIVETLRFAYTKYKMIDNDTASIKQRISSKLRGSYRFELFTK